MAVSKLWPVKNRLDHVIDYAMNPNKTIKSFSPTQFQALADVLLYAQDEEKTEHEYFVDGINCNPSTARDQFSTVKEHYDKVDGIQAYHGYLSFKEENISPELAQKIGLEFANRVWGNRFQVVVTTHLNTKHLHCHFVVNSVSFVDGKRLANDEKAWFKFRYIADEICKENGLDYNPNPKRGKQNSYYYNKEKAGMPTRYSIIKKSIDEAIQSSCSLEDFKYLLKSMGYSYQLDDNRKYWTVVPKGWSKPVRLVRLGEEYTNKRIIERIKETRNNGFIKPFQKQTIRSYTYNLPRREHKIRKKGGLYGLYLYYCYLLGYLPKYKNQNPTRLHYLLKEDLMKVDKITAQVRLLGKHNIITSEQLFLYKSKVEEEIKSLTEDRKYLQNKVRRVNIDDAMLLTSKEKISSISARLKNLNNEIRLCNEIAERSGAISGTVSVILAENEKIRRKENRNYE